METESNKALISIIIPIYNAEKYLSKCLISITSQTYKNLEIILINDGSTDQSGFISDQFSEKDNRITVIHKENGGVSSARNLGLKTARGKYIGFVDPDDWVDLKMFESLYKLINENQSDIAACGYLRENPDGVVINKITEPNVFSYNQAEALDAILSEDGFKGFTCNKLFSADILQNIVFDEDIHFCEDLLFCCQAISNSNKIVYNSTPHYHYIIHDNNASQSQFSLKKLTALDALTRIVNLLSDKEGIQLEKFKNYFMHMNISLLMNGIQENKCESNIRKRLKKNLYQYKLNELTGKFVKISCAISRININLFYRVWKFAK
ncbi:MULTISPECIES: glycosyltransferase [unclassified Bacillus (in: firmicutes)]|uniref:glycosyltransferase n=1 Tax=unclassified Bacillus (in: firmicutes) TaxID=185979 RepID=UPI001BE8B3B4|nr:MULTISPECIES: glycosyltransferase [unclassified Bacillus (in: firmicutes)]MBT2614119.1 glycosyltransferase [Bacillus sp. ISL-78]MBT2629370.1 glycosyltransferase [Bacillus sp. ISL-101]